MAVAAAAMTMLAWTVGVGTWGEIVAGQRLIDWPSSVSPPFPSASKLCIEITNNQSLAVESNEKVDN